MVWAACLFLLFLLIYYIIFYDSNINFTDLTRFHRRYFQYAHFIPIVGVGKRGEYQLVHGDLPRQHPFETTLRFTGPVPVPSDSRQ